MKKFFVLLCSAVFCGWCVAASAQTIDLRISVHVILHPTTGVRPPGITNEVFYMAYVTGAIHGTLEGDIEELRKK